MGEPERNGQALSACQQYQTLLAVSEAIVSHRDLATLFHDLAGRLHPVVRFDNLALLLHDATSNTIRLHVLEAYELFARLEFMRVLFRSVPAGLVFESQQPFI